MKTEQPTNKIDVGQLSDELEGRIAGVLDRFFRSRQEELKQVADHRPEALASVASDVELVELSLATNALLFQLSSLIVSIHRKTGGKIEDIIKLEQAVLKTLVPIAQKVRDDSDVESVREARIYAVN